MSLRYNEKLDDCVFLSLSTGKEMPSCVKGFYYNHPNVSEKLPQGLKFSKEKGGAVETGYKIYHRTLASTLTEIEEFAKSKGYEVGEYFPVINHVGYGNTERTTLSLSKDGKEAKSIAVQYIVCQW